MHAEIGGARLAYTDVGRGPPLILIHGSLCDARYWKAQQDALAVHFRVITPSLRFYWPETAPSAGTFSIAQHAADIAALLHELHASPAHVVGHSRGGRVALEVARTCRSVVRTLVLADPGLTAPEGTSGRPADTRGSFRREALALIEAGQVDEGLAVFIDTVTGVGTWPRMVPWFQDMARDNASTLAGQVREPNVPLSDEDLSMLSVPTLLIGGAVSPPPYPAILDRLQRQLPDVQRVAIKGSSHGMNIGNPKAFNEAIRQFLLGSD